jgi:hypothetical protein
LFSDKGSGNEENTVKGACEGGLYPLKSRVPSSSNEVMLGTTKVSSSMWHSLLGHPSSPVVQQVLSRNKITFVTNLNKETVCDACQKGKSHQLPYSRSTSESSSPLELVFSDVWGPGPTSIGKNCYYVSFIDDFNKFTWLYLLPRKSDVFQKIS